MKALVIVDMLNDFVSPTGALSVHGAEDIVGKIRELANAARKAGLPVVYAADAHDDDDVEFNSWPRHSVKGTDGAQVIAQLGPREGDIIMEKKDLSLFTCENPDHLKNMGITELYVTGVATEYCVISLCIDTVSKTGQEVKGALSRGFKVNIVVDAIKGVNLKPGDEYRALVELGAKGARPVYTHQAVKEFE